MSTITDFIDRYFEKKNFQKTIIKLAKSCGVRQQVQHSIGVEMFYNGREADIKFCLRVSSNDTVDGHIAEEIKINYKQFYQERGEYLTDYDIFSELQDYVTKKLKGLGIMRRILKEPRFSKNSYMAICWLNSDDLCALFEMDSKEELIKYIEEA